MNPHAAHAPSSFYHILSPSPYAADAATAPLEVIKAAFFKTLQIEVIWEGNGQMC